MAFIPLRTALRCIALVLFPSLLSAQQVSSGQDAPVTTIQTTVRRVIVDVVVTDHDGKPVAGLTKQDFSVLEDNRPQRILSFEPFGFSKDMDYLPSKMPPVPPNSFVNLPALPEKGPLYVLLYDLVNTEKNEDQVFARQQLVKFVQDKPEGTRFAIFMLSDGLHMVQGFTADKSLLYAAINPAHSHPHVPKIFLMGKNFGQNDPGTAILALQYLANYLDGLPGRKNLIWLAGNFPVTLFPSNDESVEYIDEAKRTLDLLARSQVAVYPVDVRGVSVENPHAPSGSTGGGGINSDSREHVAASSASPGPSGGTGPGGGPGYAPAAGSISPAVGGIGYNTLISSYMTADEIARATGGKAFYSTNDVKEALTKATEEGASYYTLSYAPSNQDHAGKLHNIRVDLARRGYTLAYRRGYYGLDPRVSAKTLAKEVAGQQGESPPSRKAGDSLGANMEHGAPIAHALIFGAHIQPVGAPAMGTPEQMAQLADESAFIRTRRGRRATKPLPPITLQRYAIRYMVTAHQLQVASKGTAPNLEVAAAAYDTDGLMLNATVNLATLTDSSSPGQRKSYRVEQELLVPLAAASIRLAVRDATTDRIGAMEVTLPLHQEPQSAIR